MSLIEYYMMVPASKILPKYYFSVFYVIDYIFEHFAKQLFGRFHLWQMGMGALPHFQIYMKFERLINEK